MFKDSSFIRSSWELENFWSFSLIRSKCGTFPLRAINISILTASARIDVAKNVRLSNTTSLIVGSQASSFFFRVCDLEAITEYRGFIQEAVHELLAQHILLLDFVLENVFECELFVFR